jgi:hypothetical protein
LIKQLTIKVPTKDLGMVQVKGKEESLRVFEVEVQTTKRRSVNVRNGEKLRMSPQGRTLPNRDPAR